MIPIYGFKCLNASQFKKNTHEINRELLVKDQSQNNFLKDEIDLKIKEIINSISSNRVEALRKAKILLKRLNNEDPNIKFIEQYYDIYNLLGILNSSLGNFDISEKYYSKSLELITKRVGSKNDYLIYTKSALVNVLNQKKLFSKARQLNEECINEINDLYGENSLFLVSRLNSKAKILMDMGKYQKAEEISLIAQNIVNKKTKNGIKYIYSNTGLLTFSVLDHLITISNLAFIYNSLGNFFKSEDYYLKALDLFKNYEYLSSDKVLFAKTLNNLGSLYIDKRKLIKAEKYLLKSLEINKIENFQAYIAINLLNLGTIYENQGLLKKAEEYYLKSLEQYEIFYGKNNINLSSIQIQLANLYTLNEEYEKAKKLLLKTLKIQKDNLPANHPSITTTLNNLAVHYAREKDFKKAEKIYLERLDINEKTYGKLHPSVAKLKYNLGVSSLQQKNYDEAESYLLDSLKDLKKIFGTKNRELQNTLEKLSTLYYLKKNYKKSNYFYKKAAINSYDYIYGEIPYLLEDERYIARAFGMGTEIFDRAVKTPSMAENAFFTRLNRYGVLENIERYQFDLIRSLGGEVENYIFSRNEINERISNIKISKKEKNTLINEKKLIEKKITNFIQSSIYKYVEVKDVANNLKKDQILIEFTRYYPDKPLEGTFDFSNPKYLALTLNSDSEIKVFDLGNANELEDIIFDAYFAIKNNNDNIEIYLDKVSKIIFNDSIKNYIEKYKTIFISPDHALQKIPITLLRDPINKNYLSFNKNFLLVTGGKELTSKNSNRSSNSTSVIISNPNFNFLNKNNKKENLVFRKTKENLRSKDLLSQRWESKEGFEIEGNEIHKLIKGDLITGRNATTRNVLNIKSPKILHIISHGFYFKPDYEGENALTRTGVVLAGANDPNILDDGYLTALEISSMDLKGTELVTISACESGEGDIRIYEPLNGIRRSLFLAGAKSTLLSLWKVDDDATTAFMIDFYKNLKEGMYKNKALSLTQKKFRDGIIKSEFGDEWTNIFYWGAFQISGDMSPIEFEN